MQELTEKQAAVFGYIEGRLDEGVCPSQREIADHFGMRQNSVFQILGYLKDKGYLTEVGGHRGLRLSAEYVAFREDRRGVPIVGRVAAGEPILAEENIETYVDVGDLLGLSEGVFFLRVQGESMVDEGIMDGDLVAVDAAAEVGDGQIGVVMLDDEATVKRVYFQENRIALKPANRAGGYRTRYVKRDEKAVRIIGRVVGCLRSM